MNHLFDIQCTAERTIIQLDEIAKSSWKILGHYRYRAARSPREIQTSGKSMVVILFLSGIQPFVVNGEQHVFSGGQGICLPPHTEYGTDHFPEQKGELIWLIIDVSSRKRFKLPGYTSAESTSWLQSMLDDNLPLLFRPSSDTMMEAKRVINATGKSEVEKRARLSLILDGLSNDRSNSIDSSFSMPTKKVIRWIEENIDGEMFGVERMATISGLSVSRFQTTFKNDTGISPADYVLRRKLLEAQRLLRLGKTITEVTMDLGFSSSQYFSTVFKRYMLLSPSRWLKSL